MKRFITSALLLALCLTACGSAAAPPSAVPATKVPAFDPTAAPELRTLTVFAAASLTDAFREIGQAFEAANPGVTVTFNFAGSQMLVTQIQQGAPADVIAAASGTNMDAVVSAGFVDKGAPQVFLTNNLLVILPPKNPASVETLQDLSKPGVKMVLAADTVPAGKYARQILDNLSTESGYGTDFGAKVLANVVSNETDVKQVLAKVKLGEADAGIVYVSDSIAAPELKTIQIPADLNVIAKYPIAPLIKSANAELGRQFIAYVLSADGQATLKKWGFAPVE